MDQILHALRQNLATTRNRMKQLADYHQSDRSFDIGDLVYLRLQPYKQQSLKSHQGHKLSPHYYGPYKILHKIGEVAYALEFPPNSNIHNVFHVSCLKKYLGAKVTPHTTLPILSEEQTLTIPPDKILASRQRRLRNRIISEHLVQWVGYNADKATWEPDEFIQQHPHLQRCEDSTS